MCEMLDQMLALAIKGHSGQNDRGGKTLYPSLSYGHAYGHGQMPHQLYPVYTAFYQLQPPAPPPLQVSEESNDAPIIPKDKLRWNIKK